MSGLETELRRIKERTRAAWATGEYAAIARRNIWDVGDRIVRAVGVREGEDVLDVACGTGNAAIRAALRGARVTGVDLTPELFEAGRREADAAGVQIEWVEGDAEALPFPDESFDVVVSVFGGMSAPRHEVTARELARVLRAGGRLGVCAWTPDGSVGRTIQVTSKYLPPLPELAQPPILWGSEEHVRSLFAGTGIELQVTRDRVHFPAFDSADDEVEFYSTKLGPAITARRIAEANGTWRSLRDEMASLHDPNGEVAEYLQIVGTR